MSIQCLSEKQLSYFFNLIFDVVERVGETYVVHAAVGDVVWAFNTTSQLWCIQ